MAYQRRGVLYWSPRILSLAFAIFLSLFALDVFGEQSGFWRTLAALGIHLIPTGVVIALLLLAWRWESIGAALFTALGVAFLLFFPRARLLSAPLFLVAALFLADWLKRGELRARPGGH